MTKPTDYLYKIQGYEKMMGATRIRCTTENLLLSELTNRIVQAFVTEGVNQIVITRTKRRSEEGPT